MTFLPALHLRCNVRLAGASRGAFAVAIETGLCSLPPPPSPPLYRGNATNLLIVSEVHCTRSHTHTHARERAHTCGFCCFPRCGRNRSTAWRRLSGLQNIPTVLSSDSQSYTLLREMNSYFEYFLG